MQSFFFALAAVVVQCGHAFVPNPGVVVVGKSFAVPTVRLTKVRAAGRGAAAPLAATKEKPETELMKKAEFVAEMAQKSGLTKTQADAALAAFVETLTDTLSDGKKVNLQGFGTFEPRFRAARQGRNPRTGESISIKPGYLPAFTAAKALKDAVKQNNVVDE